MSKYDELKGLSAFELSEYIKKHGADEISVIDLRRLVDDLLPDLKSKIDYLDKHLKRDDDV